MTDPDRIEAEKRAAKTDAEWKSADMSEAEIRRIEARWKSDVDKKLDQLCRFSDEYGGYLALCLKREQERDKLRSAVIEKTWGSIILAGMGFLGLAVWQWLKEHMK